MEVGVEVLAQAPGCDLAMRLAARRGDNPRVDAPPPVLAQPHHGAALERAEQLPPDLGEQRAAMRQIQHSALSRSVPWNAPLAWPKRSEATVSAAVAPQLKRMSGRRRRSLAVWIAVATSALPVPLSPEISTRAAVSATSPI